MKKRTKFSRESFASWTEVSIRYSDLDPNGHVNNGAINQYFEDGRVKFREDLMGGLGREILTGFAIAHFEVSYYSALNYPGSVEVGTVVTRIGETSFGLGQAIFVGSREIAGAHVVSVYFDPATGTKKHLPEELRSVLKKALL